MDDNDNQSTDQNQDDLLQNDRDMFSPTRDEERLEQDDESPAADPDDTPRNLPQDFPAGDTGVDQHEQYDEGRELAEADNFEPEEGQKVFPVELDHEDEDNGNADDSTDETDEEE